jgi:hypothetical protein
VFAANKLDYRYFTKPATPSLFQSAMRVLRYIVEAFILRVVVRFEKLRH